MPPGILSGDVERVRIGEDAGIAVRGGQDGSDRLADADRLPRELGGPPAYPGRELNRGFQPEDLVDRIRPHTRIRLEDVELIRMVEQETDPIAEQVHRCFEAGHQHEAGGRSQLAIGQLVGRRATPGSAG